MFSVGDQLWFVALAMILVLGGAAPCQQNDPMKVARMLVQRGAWADFREHCQRQLSRDQKAGDPRAQWWRHLFKPGGVIADDVYASFGLYAKAAEHYERNAARKPPIPGCAARRSWRLAPGTCSER